MSELNTTPLTPWHVQQRARMVEFAGYSMPVQYEGVMAEHRAVRNACGIFDVSHMAELSVRGDSARQAVDRLVTNDVSRLAPGRVLYTALCRESGTVLDDLLVYCLEETRFLVVANASNHVKVRDWMVQHLPESAQLTDETERTALFALQGPRSRAVLKAWERAAPARETILGLEYYQAAPLDFGGVTCLVSRTGYTGEWGYEIYVPVEHALEWWEEILATGEAEGLTAVGLGARDTLRLEAGYSLYGHELDEDTTPFEAGIGWVVKLKGEDFIGKDALVQQKATGIPRRTVGLQLEDRAIGRQGAPVHAGGEVVGEVTSGTFSPTLERSIALARIRQDAADETLAVEIRGRLHASRRVALPFVPSRVKG